MIEKRKNSLKALLAASAMSVMMVMAPSTAVAQQCPGDESGPSKVLSTPVARVLQTIFEQIQADQQTLALQGLNDLIAQRGDGLQGFDKATTYELRGSVKAGLEDFNGAKRDFEVALATNELPQARNNQLRYFLAQLSFQQENYQAAISGLNNWINTARNCNIPVDENAYYLLAAAYTQITPARWRDAANPAERAIAASSEPKKAQYDLLNLIYSELGNNDKRGPLLEKMVGFWPGTKTYWTQLSGAYSQAGRDRDAFSVVEVAYRAGLLTTEGEMLTLIQYYSFFDNPFRGANVLEREMAAGNVKRSQKNLVLLSQLWSQSREHKKSIPILQEAARGSDTGVLAYRLGQVLLADEQYANSQRALEQALNKGGLKSKDAGDAWLLLGTARFNQAGPEDVSLWNSARNAFKNAQRYEGARKRASDWIKYIDAVEFTYVEGVKLERAQIIERCEADLNRIEQSERIEDLQGTPVSDEVKAERQAKRAECSQMLAKAEAATAELSEAQESARNEPDISANASAADAPAASE